MGAALVPVILVVALVAAAVYFGKQFTDQRALRRQEITETHHETLALAVAPGQDPAAVIVALEAAGFAAITSSEDSRVVDVVCPDGREASREHVRSIAAQAISVDPATDPPGSVPVRFVDE